MNNLTKTIITSIIAAIVVVGVALSVFHTSSTTTVVQQPSNIVKGTSPEVSSPYFIVNGMTTWHQTMAINTASSTLCTFQAPVASSTIQYVSIRITGNSNPNNLEIDISTTTTYVNSGTTTSPLARNFIVPANTGAEHGYVPILFNTSKIYPGQGLNIVVATSTYATTPYSGICQAVFLQY